MKSRYDLIHEVGSKASQGFKGGACTSEMIECILEYVTGEMTTVETGCGTTTAAFAICSGDHSIIDPQSGKAHAVRDACKTGCSDYNPLIRVFSEESKKVWSRFYIDAHLGFDFALMDGCDRMPDAAIDAANLAELVKRGGYLLLDDKAQDGIVCALKILEHWTVWKKVKDLGRAVLWQKG